MDFKFEKKLTHELASREISSWPNSLKLGIKSYWLQSIADDSNGLISAPTLKLIYSQKYYNQKEIQLARYLAASSIFLWTAANLQDDIYDQKNKNLNNLILAEACLLSSQKLAWKSYDRELANIFATCLHKVNNSNYQELNKNIKPSLLNSVNKSRFLLISPLLLVRYLNWPDNYRKKLLLSGLYALAAKQLADDVYDYKDDWLSGRKNSATWHLKSLPSAKMLPRYYMQQAERIMRLVKKSENIIKKIPLLKGENCWQEIIGPVKTNYLKALANLKDIKGLDYKQKRNH